MRRRSSTKIQEYNLGFGWTKRRKSKLTKVNKGKCFIWRELDILSETQRQAS
jgi:hypothetical protein